MRKGDTIELANAALETQSNIAKSPKELTEFMKDLQRRRENAKSALPGLDKIIRHLQTLQTRVKSYLKVLTKLPYELEAVRSHAALCFSRIDNKPLWEVTHFAL